MGIILCEGILYFLLFILGASIFSFLNVIVYRVPKHMTFVKGRSFCPSCGHTLGLLDLFPVFSYLFLGGKCRYCKTKIGMRSFWTEVFGGILAIICYIHFENYAVSLTNFVFFSILMVVTLFDIDTMEIEDGCHIALVALAVVTFVFKLGPGMVDRLIGMLCISVPMLILTMLIPGAFGGGDIKLMAASGLFLGWKLTLVGTFIGFLTGGIYGIYLLGTGKKGKKEHFAFGPFLCLGMGIAVLYGMNLLKWYLGLFGL